MMLLLTLLVGCMQPEHLQYDYGRAYLAAFTAQADLTRPSAADAVYPLTGVEAVEMSKRLVESTTTKASGKVEAVK